MTMKEELLTIEQAARLLNIGRETVERWIERGLPTVKQEDGTQLIQRSDLDAFLVAQGQGRSRDAASEL